MAWLILLGIFAASCLVWCFLYMFGLALNGAMEPSNVFHYLWEEVTWLEIFPGWKQRRAKFLRITEPDRMSEIYRLPGLWHFFWMHIFLPFGPSVIYILTY